MFQEREKTLQGLWITLDVLGLCAAFVVALLFRVYHESLPFLGHIPALEWRNETLIPANYAVLLAVSIVAWVLPIKASGLYGLKAGRRLRASAFAILRALCMAVLAAGAAVFVLKMNTISRLFFAYFFAWGTVFLLASHVGLLWFYKRVRRTDLGRRHALVLGAGRPAAWFAHILQDAAEHGYHLVGVLLTKKTFSPQSIDVPVIGTIDDLEQTLIEYPVDEVFAVGSAAELVVLGPLLEDLMKRGRVVSLVSTPAVAARGVRGRVTEFSGVPMISFGPMPRDEVNTTLKRSLDVIVAGGILVACAPLLLLLAAVISVLDPGPIFFRQERLGKDGEPFRLIKFRSMRTDAEQLLRDDVALYKRYVANGYKLPEHEDPRVSKLGRWLRRTSLDELPQLWNVLCGDMTLVGPRPIVPDEIQMYQPYEDLLLSVRPGITGYWQISGRSRVAYPERAFLDLDYIGGHRLSSDLSILLRTVPVILRGSGAH